MEVLQRLQPLDILFAIVWAGIIGWGLQTGLLRQLGMLVGLYGATIVSGTLYRTGGVGLAAAFGADILPRLEFAAYLALFLVAFGLIGVLIWRAYPMTRLSRRFGIDNVLGAGVATIWGTLLLIAVLTILRFYAAVPWKEQESTQQGVQNQIQTSQVAVVLELVAAPLWQIMVPWFPAPVTPKL
ncbi:MAG TPA: CvpA family protein [Chloroflexota bacterium]|nr:CvpA family protein [Chloroflexota bacterium]